MNPNWLGIVLGVVFVAVIAAGFFLWMFQIYTVVRHFVYIRQACSDWPAFFSRFKVGTKVNVRSILSPGGLRNLELSKRLHGIGIYIFIVLMIVFALGMLWGGWSGNST